MRILVLNGSPRPKGNTKQMVDSFRDGAESAGHKVDVVDICRKKIAGSLFPAGGGGYACHCFAHLLSWCFRAVKVCP